MLIQQFGQVPLADVAVVCHLLEGEPLGAVLHNIGMGPADQEAVGVLSPFRRLRLRRGRQPVQHVGHVLQGLVQLLRF